MIKSFENFDAHAYVDDSLVPADRLSFEAAVRRDAKLRARVEAWESQNEAIRLAFGGVARSPRPAPLTGRQPREKTVTGPSTGLEPTQRLSRLAVSAAGPSARGRAMLGALVFVLSAAAFCGGPNDPRRALMQRTEAALRLASAFADARLDLASDDPAAVSAWLGGRFAHVDAHELSPPGWSLIGARIVDGVTSAAALVLFEDAIGGRAALMLEPVDGLGAKPPAVDRNGAMFRAAGVQGRFAYAVVGPARSGVQALIPTLAAHPGP